jgi:hypothetical protein
MPPAGDNPVSFTVAANSTGNARTGRITVRDKVRAGHSGGAVITPQRRR